MSFFTHLKAWWAVHVTWVAWVIYFLDPSVKKWLLDHPAYGASLGVLWMLILNLLNPPAPLQKLAATLRLTPKG